MVVIAEPTSSLLLDENRHRLLRNLAPRLRALDERYEMPSAMLAEALAIGRIADTEDVCDWLIAWETYCALEASGFPWLE